MSNAIVVRFGGSLWERRAGYWQAGSARISDRALQYHADQGRVEVLIVD